MKNIPARFSLRGMLPFEKEDAFMYHINETQIELFFRKLRKNKFIFLRGGAGSGKTSFLNCIVTAQIAQYFINNSLEWETTSCRPGLDPCKNLAIAIAKANVNTRKQDAAVSMEALLRSGSSGLLHVFEQFPIHPNKCLLIVIDALEDIFFLENFYAETSPSTAFKIAQDFINLLWTFERQSGFPVYIVTSFSNLFYDRIAQYPKLLSLFHQTEFRFEGFTVQDIEPIVDKLTPSVLHDCQDMAHFKQSLIHAFHAGYESNELDSTWRLQFSQIVKLTFQAWGRGYAYIQNKMAESPALKKIAGDPYLPRLVNDLLHQESLITSSKAGRLSHSLTKDEQNELTELVQMAQQQEKSKSITEWYQVYGSADNAVREELQRIFAAKPEMKKVSEFLIKSFTTSESELRPLRYRTLVGLLQSTHEYTETHLKECITQLGNGGTGLLLTVPSSRIEEEMNVLGNRMYIDPDAVVAVRNKNVVLHLADVTEWIKDEHQCISEYLNYAQMAKKESTLYPIALKIYAEPNTEESKREELKQLQAINDFLHKDRFWAALHTHNETRFASFEDTKSFIARGIEYWKGIRKAEEDRIKEEKRLQSIKRKLILLGFAVLVVFVIRSVLDLERKKLIKQVDCIHDDRFRVYTLIASQYIVNIEDNVPQDSVQVHRWMDSLRKRTTKAEELMISLHESSLFTFAYKIFAWKREQRELADTSMRSTRRRILEESLKTGFFRTRKQQIEVIEGYKLYDGSELPKEGLFIIDCSHCEHP